MHTFHLVPAVGRRHLQAAISFIRFFAGFRALTCAPMALLLYSSLAASGQRPQQMSSTKPTPALNRAALVHAYGQLPLSFEANRGQTDSQVRFLSRGEGYSLFLTDKEAVLALRKTQKNHDAGRNAETSKVDVVRMQLEGADRGLRISGENRLPGTVNYFTGKDSKNWRSNVPTYAKVKYAGVYPGVDLIYYGNQRQLEYDFAVAPGADPGSIRLHFDGAKKSKVDADGNLRIIASNGAIVFHKPVLYQEKDGLRELVEGRFVQKAGNFIGFAPGIYDHSRPLIIDPTLAYSTYLGGTTEDVATAVAVDNAGDAYVAGYSYSTDFPVTSGALQATNDKAGSALTAFVAKLNPGGTALLYATYLGGSTNDAANGIAIDGAGNAYVAGKTESVDFPTTTGAFQTANNNGGVAYTGFVSKLNPTGTALVYSTYLGGSDSNVELPGDESLGIAVNTSGVAYVVGYAVSNDFPVTNGAFQTSITNFDGAAFVAALSADGSGLIYGTFLGGSSAGSIANAVAIDSAGDAYVGGSTSSSSFPVTSSAIQTSFTSVAAFVAKLNPTGTGLLYATYLGGSGFPGYGDSVNAIALDSAGDAFVAGQTYSTKFPVTSGAFQTTNQSTGSDGGSAFVASLNPSGTALRYSTYLGGNWSANAYAIQVDASGNAYVAGNTDSTTFPVTSNALQSTNSTTLTSGTGFITEFNSAGSAQVYSTYFGGNFGGTISGLALDSSLNVYIAGETPSTTFPVTAGAFQTTNHASTVGLSTGFVSKLDMSGSITKVATTTTLTASPNPQIAGKNVTFTVTVQPGSGSGVPSGQITTTVDGNAGPTLTLSDGQATFTSSSLTAGSHTIVASYGGDTNYSASSTSIVETITSSATAASIAVVSGSGQTTAYGSAFANPLVVIVKDASGNPVSGAVVTFTGSGLKFSSSTATTGANGEASVTATAIASGSLTASATTTGVAGSANFSLTATKPVLSVTATSISVPYNQSIPKLTYSVTGFVNGDTSSVLSGSPSETTTAAKGSAPGTYPITISQGTLSAANYTFGFVNGTLTVTSLGTVATPAFSVTSGTYSLAQTVTITDATAGAIIYYTTDGSTPTTGSSTYSSAINVTATETIKAIAVATGYTESAVASATYTISLPTATFTLGVSPSSTTINQGGSGSFTVTVTPQNGFTQAVSFNCSGLPSGDTCAFSPTTVTPSGSPVTSTLTIAPASSAQNLKIWGATGGSLAVAIMFLPLRRRRIRYFAAFAIVLLTGIAVTGCGGSPKSQNYTVTVNATGGTVTQQASIALTVKQ